MSMSMSECTPYRCIMCGELVNPMTDICMGCGVNNYLLEQKYGDGSEWTPDTEAAILDDYEVYGGD